MYSALKEVEHNCPSLSVGCECDFLPKRPVWKEAYGLGKGVGGICDFVEKPDKHYLSQAIKVNINSDKSC